MVDSSNPNYEKIKDLLRNNPNGSTLFSLLNMDRTIKGRKSKIFECKNGRWYFKNELLPIGIGKLIAEFEEASLPVDSIVRFWNRLRKNPLESARNELILFVQSNNICITEDGMLVLYKYVDEDFKDYYSRTYDNTPGRTVDMKREDVDKNRTNTCSKGLHVCSWQYLIGICTGKRIVEVFVDPVDVVSIPSDYNNSKMRCCKYEVIREITKSGEPIPVEVKATKEQVDEDVKKIQNHQQKKIYDIYKVSIGSKGRVLIPASFITKLKKNLKFAYVTVESKKITISSKKTDIAYTVDDHYNIRISATLLKEACLEKCKNFRLEFIDGRIELKGAK
jgi:hypothetical protein